jgi:hypothetical protein
MNCKIWSWLLPMTHFSWGPVLLLHLSLTEKEYKEIVQVHNFLFIVLLLPGFKAWGGRKEPRVHLPLRQKGGHVQFCQ